MRNEDTKRTAATGGQNHIPANREDENDVFLNGLKDEKAVKKGDVEDMPKEYGGPKGLEPTRYGDWEAKGRCYDF